MNTGGLEFSDLMNTSVVRNRNAGNGVCDERPEWLDHYIITVKWTNSVGGDTEGSPHQN
jgi:hypothetical protein